MNESKTVDHSDKFYPEADEWMWNYCIFLGKFTDSNGTNYDLGIWIDKNDDSTFRVCDATVHSNEPGDYTSGEISKYMWDTLDKQDRPAREWKKEVYRRAKDYGHISFELD